MDSQPSSTQQSNGSQLSQLFMQGMQAPSGYQQQPIAPIGAPMPQGQLMPSPADAAAATRARILGRTPMAAPAAAPQRQPLQQIIMHGEGGSRGHGT